MNLWTPLRRLEESDLEIAEGEAVSANMGTHRRAFELTQDAINENM